MTLTNINFYEIENISLVEFESNNEKFEAYFTINNVNIIKFNKKTISKLNNLTDVKTELKKAYIEYKNIERYQLI